MIRDNKLSQVDTGLVGYWGQTKFQYVVGLLVPRFSKVSVGRTPNEHEPCVCPVHCRRPKAVDKLIGVEYCLAGSSPLESWLEQKPSTIDVERRVVGGKETEKYKTIRGLTGGCWHAAPFSVDEKNILAVWDESHDSISFFWIIQKRFWETIVLPQPNKVQFDFFRRTFKTHTPREMGRQVNVFADHSAVFRDFKSLIRIFLFRPQRF